jgi:ankyrin repeat protein
VAPRAGYMLHVYRDYSKPARAVRYSSLYKCKCTWARCTMRHIPLQTSAVRGGKCTRPWYWHVHRTYFSLARCRCVRKVSGMDTQSWSDYDRLYRALWDAAQQGRQDVVEELLRELLLQRHIESGALTSFLRVAALNGHVDTVALLLSAKADPEPSLRAAACAGDTEDLPSSVSCPCTSRPCTVHPCTPRPRSALQLLLEATRRVPDIDVVRTAVIAGHVGAVRMLVAAKARVNEDVDVRRSPPIEYAAKDGDLAVLQVLMDAKARINGLGRGPYGNTPIYSAAHNGHADAVQMLVAAKAELCEGVRSAVSGAADTGHAHVLGILLEAKADMDDCRRADPYGPIRTAARKGHLDAVRVFIEAKADVNRGDFPPVLGAANNGHTAIVRVLIEAKADLEKRDRYPELYAAVHLAARKGHVDVLHLLVGAKADIDTAAIDGVTALHCAARRGQSDAVLAIVRMKVDVHAAAADGSTVAGIASATMPSLLTLAKASVNGIARDGRTPLWAAAERGHEDYVTALIRAKADVDVAKDDVTPAFIAAWNGHAGVLTRLHLARADVTRSVRGWTPLLIAVAAGHIGIVRLLLACAPQLVHVTVGAGYEHAFPSVIAVRVPAGTTAAYLAVIKGHTAIQDLLQFAQEQVP